MMDRPTTDADRLDDVFAALANGTRRAILAQLADGEATVNELAEPFDLTLPAVSKHIKVLERAGLITRDRRAQFRPCAIDPEPLRAVVDWAERYRQLWDSSFDRLELYLRRTPTAPDVTARPPRPPQPTRPPGDQP